MAGTRRGFGAGPDSIRDGGKAGAPAFSKDGTLTVMQVADVQEGVDVRPETTMLLERALDACEPDLVVFTGDQLKGYSLSLRLSGEAGIRKTIADILRPATDRGIPFAVTYGNHDCQAGLVNERLEEIYRELPGCMNAVFGDEGKEPGTFCVPIMASDGSGPAMAVWLADSGGDATMGGYEAFDPETTRWLVESATELDRSCAHRVPGILFQHIPMPDVYDCLREAAPGETGVPGYRTHYRPGQRLRLDERFAVEGEVGEVICCGNENTGEFDALVAQGDFFAAFFGHDHKNSFVARRRGMLLGYSPTASFSSYGPGLDRAVRVLRFSESDPRHPALGLLSYRDLVGEETTQPVRDWMKTHMVTTVEEVLDKLPRLPRVSGPDVPGTASLPGDGAMASM
ncbi:MAG: metallophosphoesterase family protein [Atopobiaceae bacterium]|jgi:hypothetical protein|nr:metallophosphoesterase family protein [Atopobiaceae bacterium]MCH4119750.1 metallophosphoesterase family protein [Atopobiaceae bacterium]MCI1318922.1 metallophosphoesterase family protein [Atopobiaceae bacterium]MCI1388824.1 metallophosphoesterase family protein [Atopobiaceae bacterium]MCI1432556.1 metallophosphoesterase family protein [Atopobiaceae bacterium]